MFSNSKKISVRDATFQNVGGDLTIINNYTYPGPGPVSTRSFYMPHRDDWILVVSFKPFVAMVQVIFGNSYMLLIA